MQRLWNLERLPFATTIAEDDRLAELVLNWRVVEKRAFHTSQTFLEAGLTGPFMRLEAA